MANSLAEQVATLRETRVWRSIFRSGFGPTNLRRALAIQQNVFLHLSSVKIRKRSLDFRVAGKVFARLSEEAAAARAAVRPKKAATL